MCVELHVTEQLCPVTVQCIHQRSASSVGVALIKQGLWHLPIIKRIQLSVSPAVMGGGSLLLAAQTAMRYSSYSESRHMTGSLASMMRERA
jgi:hypothetical protein